MEFTKALSGLKNAIDKELERHFDISIAIARKKDDLIADALNQAKKIALAGGKRIRAALLYWAYIGAGGKEKKKILQVAAAVELVHLFLLIHDDIMDRGALRHGQKTVNAFFAQKKWSTKDPIHFGNSIAIIVGDMLYAMAIRIILEAGFEMAVTQKTLAYLQEVVMMTIVGQTQDIAIEGKTSNTEMDVLKMYENKTARYTFDGPLKMGLILTKCDDMKTIKIMEKYALPVGMAFQIQDDIIGIFGDEKKMGKSAGSDIEEGKQSLMVVRARQFAKPSEAKKMNEILGKKNIKKDEVLVFRNIITESGALEYVKKMASAMLTEGKKEIEKAIILPEAKEFLIGLVEHLEGREI